MATKTTNYNLIKPDGNDYYNVNVQNANADIIDSELKKRAEEAAAAVQSATLGGVPVPKDGNTLQFPVYPVIPAALPNPNALSVSIGNGGVNGNYPGAAPLSISIPKVTKSTIATPSYTLAEGELYFSPN